MSNDPEFPKNNTEPEMDFQLDANAVRHFENNIFPNEQLKPASVGLPSSDPDLDLNRERLGALGGVSVHDDRPLAEQVWERRQGPRQHQEDKGVRARFRREINYLVGLVERSWRGWFALIASLLLSITLLVWSVTVRRDLIEQHDQLSNEHKELQLILDDLLERWSQGELTTLKERVQSAESRVFPDYQKLAWWLNQQSEIADQLNLIMQYNLSKSLPTQIKDVAEVPVAIKVSAKPEYVSHSYLRMLEFVHGLVGDQWHLEIVNTLVQSSGVGATNMNVRIHIWVHDEDIEVPDS